MALVENRYVTLWGIEHVCMYRGSYGGKHEKRAPHKKATREQIKKQNQKNKENRVRRMIQQNFDQGDWYLTLKYTEGTRLSIEEVMKHLAKFLRTLRREYKRHSVELKYMYRVEIGRRGGKHIHVIINRLPDPDADLIISDAWTRARGLTPIEIALQEGLCPADGLVHFTHIRREGNAEALADYMVKKQPWELEDGTELTKEEKKATGKYGRSKNLIMPEPEVIEYTHRTMKPILELGPEGMNTQPNRYRTEGYMVDKNSWKQGINPFTGLSYLRYFEVPLPGRRKGWTSENMSEKQKQRSNRKCTVDVRTVGTTLAGCVCGRRKN